MLRDVRLPPGMNRLRSGRSSSLAPNEELIARLGDIRSAVERGDAQILDVRPRSYWEGSANPFGNRRIGHIPGAANVDSGAFLLHQPPYTFKGAKEIVALVRDVGMSPKRETIVHCQAGVRTTTGVFALALLGWTNVRAYDAAMAEWANRDDTPLVVEEGVRAATEHLRQSHWHSAPRTSNRAHLARRAEPQTARLDVGAPRQSLLS